MSVLEPSVTVSNNEDKNFTENEKVKNHFRPSSQRDEKYESVIKLEDKNDQNFGHVVCEIPLYSISKVETEKVNAYDQKEYTVAFNFDPRQQLPMLNSDGQEDMREPFVYDPHTRNSFVQLVLILVLLMLIATASFIALVLFTPELKEFFNSSKWLILVPAAIILLGINYAMVCSSCARQPPCNYICLLLTVIGMSLVAARVTSHYRTEIILYATMTTTIVVFVCILLACSKFDFTSWMLYVIAITTAFSAIAMIVILTMAITGKTFKPIVLIILIIGTLLEVIMLTMEIQTVIGGKSVELAEDDYALGAYMIYTSIISIFIKTVQTFGLMND